eukprot:TRINITY_DN391_c1_g3_i1.p1 TRINITY_DN391_c1_g3~~TRINITY_DN391_c1_g3_i1.p1  ORF type:complete len:549 (-),score=138.68 TRINITY_DN391_c1_g3_i1:16-1662(-)
MAGQGGNARMFGNLLAFDQQKTLLVQSPGSGVWVVNIFNQTTPRRLWDTSPQSQEVTLMSDGQHFFVSGQVTQVWAKNITKIDELMILSSTPAIDADFQHLILYDSFSSKFMDASDLDDPQTIKFLDPLPPSVSPLIRWSGDRTRILFIARTGTASDLTMIETQCDDWHTTATSSSSSSAPSALMLTSAAASSSINVGVIVGPIIAGLVCLAVAAAVTAFLIKRRRNSAENSQKTPQDIEINLKKISGIQDWIIASPSIELGPELGRGAFGVVYKAKWRNADCVVKQLSIQDEARIDTFWKEARHMIELRPHVNVCRFLGIVAETNFPISIVTEFLECGSLWDMIFKQEIEIDMRLLISMAHDVASGMSHIHNENILHCDLAARNLLVRRIGNEYIIKVSDFGMAHTADADTYDVKATMTVPVRWCAPEIFEKHLFSKSADVWAFGIVLWEMSQQTVPYFELLTHRDIVAHVLAGNTLPRPTRMVVVDAFWELMNRCWMRDPQKRPTFQDLAKELEDVDWMDAKKIDEESQVNSVEQGERDYSEINQQ